MRPTRPEMQKRSGSRRSNSSIFLYRPPSRTLCHSEPVTVSLAWESVPQRGAAALQGSLV